MTWTTTDLRVNPANETIRLGPIAVRFLLTGAHSAGTLAAVHVMVPGALCGSGTQPRWLRGNGLRR